MFGRAFSSHFHFSFCLPNSLSVHRIRKAKQNTVQFSMKYLVHDLGLRIQFLNGIRHRVGLYYERQLRCIIHLASIFTFNRSET